MAAREPVVTVSAGAVNRLVSTVQVRSPRGACYLVESGADQHQLIVPNRRGPLRWEPATGPDVRTTTLEQALQLYLVQIEPADWTKVPDGVLHALGRTADALPSWRLKTIRPYGVEGRVSA